MIHDTTFLQVVPPPKLHIALFFEGYETQGFVLNIGEPLVKELTRLRTTLKFEKTQNKRARKALKNAFIDQFGLARGGPEAVHAWQGLCRSLGLPVSGTVAACQEVRFYDSLHSGVYEA